MKHILPLLIALLLTMAGCHRPATTGELCTELQQAEALMYPHPDSALHILQAMDVPGDELNRATWALFTTQAKYKLYMNQSDSLINIALDYSISLNTPQRKALSFYLKAALLKENKQIEDAQKYYLKAIDEVEKTDDYKLAYLIYAGLGDLYAYRSLTDYALSTYETAYKYAIKSNINGQVISSYMNLARIYGKKNNHQMRIMYYNKAIELAENSLDYSKLSAALVEMSNAYNKINDYDSALYYMQRALKIERLRPNKLGEQKFLSIAQIYDNQNKSDSAIFYYKKALSSSNIYTLRNAYIGLFYLLNGKGKYSEASDNLEKAWFYNDSIQKISKERALIEMQEKYDQQKVKDEAETELRLQKQRTQMYIGIIIVTVLLAGAYARHRYRQRIARLAEAEDRIDTLTRMLEEAQASTDKEDTFVKRMLLQQLGVIRLVANTPTAQNQALLRRLTELGNDQVPTEELIVWEDLYPLIDRLYNGFHSRLKERFGSVLTDKEVQTCCLLCASFSTKEIAVITRQTSGTVYVRKSSIRKKIGAEEGSDIVEVVKTFHE